jgi:hypothetical protein
VYTPAGKKINFETFTLQDHFDIYQEIEL